MLRNANRTLCLGNETRRRLCTVATASSMRSRSPYRRTKKSKEASSLYHRISALGPNNGSVSEVLNQWISNERKQVTRYDVVGFVDQLRIYKQYDQALQLLEWMEKRGMHLSYSEQAKRIDLLWKSRGAEAAEKYFADLPKPSKNKATYGALLCCFCCEKMTEKAIALLEKMRALNFASNTFVYNHLMSLRIKLGELEKVPLLSQEMKDKRIEPDVFTYNLLMNSYASMKDIEGAERILEEFKKVNKIKSDWSVYGNLAAVYVSGGLFEKAEMTLKEIEKIDKLRDRKAFHYLLSLYASIGNASAVNRVWESLKSAFPKTTNLSYLTMLQTLSRLNDLDGLKKCFEEWEKCELSYDTRLVNVVLKTYLKEDMIEAANSFLEHAVKKGFKLNFLTYAPFIDFYVRNHQIDLAVTCLETGAPVVNENEKHIYKEKSHMLLKYLEQEKDVESVQELQRIMKQANNLNLEACDLLLETHKG